MNRYLAGAIAGTLATIPMTLVMVKLFERLPPDDQYPLPPREITDEITRRTDQQKHLSEPQTEVFSLAAHFAYGGATGALYPLPLSSHVEGRPGMQLLLGAGYGVAVWAGSYLGWVPALRILAQPTAQPLARLRLMIAAHLVWGAGTVFIGEQLAGPHPREPRRIRAGGLLE